MLVAKLRLCPITPFRSRSRDNGGVLFQRHTPQLVGAAGTLRREPRAANEPALVQVNGEPAIVNPARRTIQVRQGKG